MFTVFKALAPIYRPMLYLVSVLTMTIGNLFAMRQKNMKRFLAFSSIAQAGFILLGILGTNKLGMTSVVYFVLTYIFSNLGAFGVVAAISAKTGKEYMDDYDGLYHTNPKLELVDDAFDVFAGRYSAGCRILSENSSSLLRPRQEVFTGWFSSQFLMQPSLCIIIFW